jgi:hypothetical protein
VRVVVAVMMKVVLGGVGGEHVVEALVVVVVGRCVRAGSQTNKTVS